MLLHAHCLPKLTMASVDNQNRTSDEMITKEAVKEGYLTSHSKSASWKKNKTSLLHNRRVLPNLLRSALRMQQGIVPFLQKLRTYITTMVLATGPDSPASSIGWSKTLLLLHLPHGRVDLTQDSSPELYLNVLFYFSFLPHSLSMSFQKNMRHKNSDIISCYVHRKLPKIITLSTYNIYQSKFSQFHNPSSRTERAI